MLHSNYLTILILLCWTWTKVISDPIECDIFVAGGSTAALAAATNAARQAPELVVCLTEPTEWLGGQLTSSGVSAIDYGPENSDPTYHPPDWQRLVASLGEDNPGRCWVSVKCYRPHILAHGWIPDELSVLPNLRVFYNTVVKNVTWSDRRLDLIHAVTRTAQPGVHQWEHPLSETLQDWYSEQDSALFTKDLVEFTAPRSGSDGAWVVLDCTAYGDILVLSNASYRQGIEVPEETSDDTMDTCGQAITNTFYIIYNYEPLSYDDKLVNLTDDDFSLNGFTWGDVWSYRRSVGYSHGQYSDAKLGEVSNQNWGTAGGNDYLEGYYLLSYDDTTASLDNWAGGINITTLREAERRAREWYTWFKSQGPNDTAAYLSMAPETVTGTRTGLSMVPYTRDTRRSIGQDGFRLTKADMSEGTLQVFDDRVALGSYLYADTHPLDSCEFPDYLLNKSIVPYYIPFRALTNQDYDNLLVAGLTMAQTYFANAGTRLHPEEWLTGQAAGLGAVLMIQNNFTSQEMYENVGLLQDIISGLVPIDWDHGEETTTSTTSGTIRPMAGGGWGFVLTNVILIAVCMYG